MSRKRAPVFGETDDANLDLQGFKPKAKTPRALDPAAVKTVSVAHDFKSRESMPLRRRRTGRNVQINIKARAEAIETLYRISDNHGWVLGETLEHALAALEKALTDQAP